MQAPRITSTHVVYENRWLRVREDRLERPDGSPGLYAYVQKSPAAVIVALEHGYAWLVEQYRHPVRARFWEFPQGAWEDDPAADREALARGELAEETGLRARAMEHLGRLYFAYGMSDQPVDVWHASGLEPGPQALESTEADLRPARFALDEVAAMVRDGRIRDAASVAAWHLATAAG